MKVFSMPLAAALFAAALLPVLAQGAEVNTASAEDISVRNEIQHAIDQGLSWLAAHQATNGSWSAPEHPAVTALALRAFMGDPGDSAKGKHAEPVKKGYKFVLDHVKPDGGIYEKDLQNYNTAICMMALVAANNPDYTEILRKARRWEITHQSDLPDSPFNGGVGYGDKKPGYSDMNNTVTALEALYYTKNLDREGSVNASNSLNWAAAVQFIQNCQNLPEYNKQPTVSTNLADRGGFIYTPQESKAGGVTNAEGKVALRSYGTITYAGLLSYIYADLKKDDPRVSAAYDWLRSNYTLTENPGMGPQGYYYYLHLMSKALTLYDVKSGETKTGPADPWARALGLKLINLQKADGSWANENNRWWEKDPALVTSYSVMALEFAYRGLK